MKQGNMVLIIKQARIEERILPGICSNLLAFILSLSSCLSNYQGEAKDVDQVNIAYNLFLLVVIGHPVIGSDILFFRSREVLIRKDHRSPNLIQIGLNNMGV